MQHYAGRMAPIGWAALNHIMGISKILTDSNSDEVSMDLEVMGLWAILHQKVREDSEYKKRWSELEKRLAELADGAQDVDARDMEADRLQIRIRQFEALVSAAVRSSVLDVAQLPEDDSLMH